MIGLDVMAGSPVAWAGLAALLAAGALLVVFVGWGNRAGGAVHAQRLQRAILAGEIGVREIGGIVPGRSADGAMGWGDTRTPVRGPGASDAAVVDAGGRSEGPTHPYDLPAAAAARYTPGAPGAPDAAGAPDVAAWPRTQEMEQEREDEMDDAGETYCPACLCVALERHDERGASVLVQVGDVASAWMLAGRAEAQLCLHHQRALDQHAERVGALAAGPWLAPTYRERLAAGRHVVRLATWAGMERYGARVLSRYRDNETTWHGGRIA